jgi:Nucleotidyl transferase AbiEii toxin, Type IV TA system
MQAPTISAYPIETVIAEKLEAILALSLLTSRMKDFFDLFFISHRMKFEYRLLFSAIQKDIYTENTPPGRSPVLR